MNEPILLVPIIFTSLAAGLTFALRPLVLRERIKIPTLGWLLSLFPLISLGIVTWLLAEMHTRGEEIRSLAVIWLPALSSSHRVIYFSLYFDHLTALFVLLITGIGVLVIIYSGYYFKGDPGAWRFFSYLLLFMSAMLGLVLAGDIITLFVFWELTSLISFLLVAYKYKDEIARRSAFRALFVTGGGGIVLLAGLIFLAQVSGGNDFTTILAAGEILRQHPFYAAIFGLIAFGALTKSAQFPAHFWLPGAMSAPTPASAYLHSATMVKAGIYLLARLNPALGNTDIWFWVLSLAGLITMLLGAFLGFKQSDLKGLLAYSTVSQLGVLIALIGQDSEIAFKALVIGILAHALYKSSLFLAVGIIDHETGTRDLRRLGGLQLQMPRTMFFTILASLSMAGLPPLFGFLAKETLLATAIHPNVPEVVDWIFPIMVVLAGALILAQAGLLVFNTFFGRPADTLSPPHGHEPPIGMLLAPAIPAVLSLAVSLPVEPQFLVNLLAMAATQAYGYKVKVSLELWTGITPPLMLSGVAITLGSFIFWQRRYIRQRMDNLPDWFSIEPIYLSVLAGIDKLAWMTTRLQAGYLRIYLAIMLVGLGGLLVWFNALPVASVVSIISDYPPNQDPTLLVFHALRLLPLVFAVVTALFSVILKRDLAAILALGITGIAIAVWFALVPAPDVALVQVMIDILSTVILVLALTRLPRVQRHQAQEINIKKSRSGLLRDFGLALASGVVMSVLVFMAITTRPRPSIVSDFYNANAKSLANASDVVGAILVDFRGFDTLFEIIVFASAGLALYTLVHYANRKVGDREELSSEAPLVGPGNHLLGIHGLPTSSILHVLAYVLLPFSFVIASIQVIYGHEQPGDGFTAGVFISLALAFWYVVFGYDVARRRLKWLRPRRLIVVGLIFQILNGLGGFIWGKPAAFMAPFDYSERLGLPLKGLLPQGFYLSSAFVFELAICLVVLGAAILMMDNLGRPRQLDQESDRVLEDLVEQQTMMDKL